MMRIAALLALPLLLSCTEAEMCRLQATRDARSLDRQIIETRRDIDRGYRLVERPFVTVFGHCRTGPFGRDRFCDRFDDYYEVPINREAERAKLASLIEQRQRVEARTQAALAQCPAG